MKTFKVIVGSTNPVKINATKLAFEKIWPDKNWEVWGTEVLSGVSDQPMSDLEGIKGARNRAQKVMKLVKADFAVGLEGALQKFGNKWFESGWMVVIDKKGKEGIGSSIKMNIPNKMMVKIRSGLELGLVADEVFRTKNIKQQGGYFGAMTLNQITRTSGYMDGVMSALISFINPKLFEK